MGLTGAEVMAAEGPYAHSFYKKQYTIVIFSRHNPPQPHYPQLNHIIHSLITLSTASSPGVLMKGCVRLQAAHGVAGGDLRAHDNGRLRDAGVSGELQGIPGIPGYLGYLG